MAEQNKQLASRPKWDEREDFVDLSRLVATLIENKWLVIFVGLIVFSLGVIYAVTAPPIYKSDAMIQVEKSRSSIPGLEELPAALTGRAGNTEAQVELVRSRNVISRVVKQLNLQVVAEPVYMPVFGRYLSTRGYYGDTPPKLVLGRLEVPDYLYSEPMTLLVTSPESYRLNDIEGSLILTGEVGKQESLDNGLKIYVREMVAPVGFKFRVIKQHVNDVVLNLQKELSVEQRGRHDTGIISVSMEGTQPERITAIVNGVVNNFVRQNVERRSEEASKMLSFLDEQLPSLKKRLETAETRLREYKSRQGAAVDISVEGAELLSRATELDKQISELQLQRSELLLRFTDEHPTLKSLQSKLDQLREKKSGLEGRFKKLPATELESIRLIRNVDVANELYVQLLNRAQELRVAKAGTIGDARVVDHAIETRRPIRPQRFLIILMSAFLAVIFGVLAAFIKALFNTRLEVPETIERELGLSVYATIPHSSIESRLRKKAKRSNYKKSLLSRVAPEEAAIESLRSLRTNLQFAGVQTKNNIVTIHGPTPGIGKSFVATNLAFLLADIDKKVLLIDADMRKGHINKVLGTKRSPGLSDVISDSHAITEAITIFEDGKLHFMATGTIPPNPAELLVHTNFSNAMERFSEVYDYVIVDAPPTLMLADGVALAKHSGTNLLVVRAGVNTLKDIQIAQSRMEKSAVIIDGIIFNDMSARVSRYRYGGYYNYEYKNAAK